MKGKEREGFFKRNVHVNVDGQSEKWEKDRFVYYGDRVVIEYKLKERSYYKTD